MYLLIFDAEVRIVLNKLLILGGDLRLLSVADEFIKDGYSVSICAVDEKYLKASYNTYSDAKKAVEENDIIVFGLPLSKDNLTVNAPCYSKKIELDDLIPVMKNKIILGGMISKEFKDKALIYNKVYDYFLREELIIKNVIPTVEGAISIAIEETAFTIHGSDCLVCGFGRIGKMLSRYLKALGANVTVSARKASDMALIDCLSYNGILTSDIAKNINNYDIIFNTVPYNIINKEALEMVSSDSLIIDLASKPGGVDFKAANELGKNVIWALSLPGKVAPRTAGRIIKTTICNILSELEG